MPRLNAVKSYFEGAYYHIYNRGVAKSAIFHDDQDYRYFLRLLRFYLCENESESKHALPHKRDRRPDQNLSKEVSLLAYCLMPNHFHLLIQQQSRNGLTLLMKRLSNSYSWYLNNKYQRTGHVFECSVQALLEMTDEQLIHTARYIHRNPCSLGVKLETYPYSNYKDILNGVESSWTKTNLILDYFELDPAKYKDFVLSAGEAPLHDSYAYTSHLDEIDTKIILR